MKTVMRNIWKPAKGLAVAGERSRHNSFCLPVFFISWQRIEQQHRLSTELGDPISDRVQYRRLVGRLIYLTIIHGYITYSVHILGQFMQDPRQGHWDAAMLFLWYLKSTPGQGNLLSGTNDLSLQVHSCFDWPCCPMTRCSVTGYLVRLGTAPVWWKTKKQPPPFICKK